VFDLARWRRRWPWLDHLLSVNDRFGDIGGGPLSSSIALAGFLSLFPLLLVGIAVVGFLASGSSDFTATVIDNLGLEGRAAEVVEDAITTAEGSARTATIVGLVGLLWAGLGVVGSLQNAMNAAWQTKGRGLLDRAVALGWLVGAGALFLASTSLGPTLQLSDGRLWPLTVLLGLVLTLALFLWTYHLLGNSHVGWRVHLPGALLVAVGFEVLKFVGSVYVPRAIASASALYGAIGVVFAVLAWFAIYARLIVYGAVLNVVRYEAREGTVTVQIEVPRIEGEVPLSTTRGGAVDERVEAADQ
jgi:membrane protein